MKASFWMIAVSIAAAAGIVAAFPRGSRQVTPSSEQHQSNLNKQGQVSQESCELGTSVNGTVLVGRGFIPLMKGPGRNTGRLVNETASSMSRIPIYEEVSADNDLEQICETRDWVLVKIVGGDGRRIDDGKTGWIEKRYLVKELTSDRKAGLFWDILNDKEIPAADKEWVRKGALKVLADEKRCARIVYGGRALSGGRGFYAVGCMANDGATTFEIDFQKSDVISGTSLTAPPPPIPYGESESRALCDEAIKRQASFPSTVDIKTFTGYGTRTSQIGNRETIEYFSAKNAFGLKLSYVARCVIEPTGKLEINISEEK